MWLLSVIFSSTECKQIFKKDKEIKPKTKTFTQK